MEEKIINKNGAGPTSGDACATQPNIQMIPVDKIKPFRWSIGIRDKEIYDRLKENIEIYGINNPPKVRPIGGGFYEPYIGDHRVMIAKEQNLKEIPCIVEDISEDKALEICLADNLCRAELSSQEQEDKVTELWNSGRYNTRAELGRKIGLTGERVGQLILAKELRDKAKDTLDKSISTESILATRPLKNDEDRIALLMQLKAGKIKAGDISSKAKMLQKLQPQEKDDYLYNGKPIDSITKNSIKLPEKEKVKTVKVPVETENLAQKTYYFLKDLGSYIATIEDDKQRDQAVDYVKFSNALLLRILVKENKLSQSNFDTFVKDVLQIDAGIIDSFNGTNTIGIGWFID